MDKDEVIVEVGAEGGSIVLVGKRHARGWVFSRLTDEYDFDDEKSIIHRSAEVDSWESALRLLDKYPWQTLYPSKVHPEFRAQVWAAVQKRLADDEEKVSKLEGWQTLCT